MKWLFLGQVRSWTLLAASASFALNLTQLAPSLFMLQVFDRVFASRSIETLVMLALGTLLVLLLGYSMDALRARALAGAGSAVDRALTPVAVQTLMLRTAHASSDAATESMADVVRLRSFLSSPGVYTLFDAPWLPIYLMVIAAMDARLGLAATLAAGLLFAVTVVTDRSSRTLAEQATTLSKTVGREIDGLLQHAETIVGMGTHRELLEQWQERHSAALAAQQKFQQRAARLAAFSRLLRQIVQSGLLAIGAALVVVGDASPGIMVATTILLARALQPVDQLVGGWKALREVRAAWARLTSQPAETHRAPTQANLPLAGSMSVEDVRFAAPSGARQGMLINGVSLTLLPGSCTGLIGPNGAGKSVLTRLLTGLIRPTVGRICWGGTDLRQIAPEQLARAVGYLPQEVVIFNATVAQNIAGLGTTDAAQVEAAARLVGIHEWIQQLPQGYATAVGAGGLPLSSGQRQGVGLARAVFGEPRLVILDEPDAHLDGAGEAALNATIGALKARGAIVVAVAHRPALLRCADQVAILRSGGTLEACGPRDTVLNRLIKANAVVQPLHRAAVQHS